MLSSYQQYLSGLGDAEDSVLGTDESAGDSAGGDAPSGGTAPSIPGPSGGGWETVLSTAASALPVLATKAADAYHTYEASHGGLAPSSGATPASAPAPAPRAGSSRPWYESPAFLVAAGLGLGLVIVIVTRKK